MPSRDELTEEIPQCASDGGHKWVMGRPIFEDGAEKTMENVEYNTRQCRVCGYHDERDPRE